MKAQSAETRSLGNWYYALACVLILFGILGLLSIGAPFLTLGIAMFCLAPFAKRRSPVVLPILVAIATFWALLFATGPVTCSVSLSRTLRDGEAAQRIQEPRCITALGTPVGSFPN
ncbi:MAG TPA: hypothetical protein VG408_02030, partial [Actinomycetota bacterium]|nr:hypothetical protein [Actinomycetota bacterium]